MPVLCSVCDSSHPRHEQNLRLFGTIVAGVLCVVLIVSLVGGRKFGACTADAACPGIPLPHGSLPLSAGPYYFSNILLLCLSIACVWICQTQHPSRTREVFAHEVYYLCGFVALVAGTIASFVFLTRVTSRVDTFCADHAEHCERYSEAFMHTVRPAPSRVCLVHLQ